MESNSCSADTAAFSGTVSRWFATYGVGIHAEKSLLRWKERAKAGGAGGLDGRYSRSNDRRKSGHPSRPEFASSCFARWSLRHVGGVRRTAPSFLQPFHAAAFSSNLNMEKARKQASLLASISRSSVVKARRENPGLVRLASTPQRCSDGITMGKNLHVSSKFPVISNITALPKQRRRKIGESTLIS